MHWMKAQFETFSHRANHRQGGKTELERKTPDSSYIPVGLSYYLFPDDNRSAYFYCVKKPFILLRDFIPQFHVIRIVCREE
jgi:hypothetical protein